MIYYPNIKIRATGADGMTVSINFDKSQAG